MKLRQIVHCLFESLASDCLLPQLAAQVLQLLLEVLSLDVQLAIELVALVPPLVYLVHDGL